MNNKTPKYTLDAQKNYMKKHGLISYSRRIKPEWKKVLDEILTKLRQEEAKIQKVTYFEINKNNA